MFSGKNELTYRKTNSKINYFNNSNINKHIIKFSIVQ